MASLNFSEYKSSLYPSISSPPPKRKGRRTKEEFTSPSVPLQTTDPEWVVDDSEARRRRAEKLSQLLSSDTGSELQDFKPIESMETMTSPEIITSSSSRPVAISSSEYGIAYQSRPFQGYSSAESIDLNKVWEKLNYLTMLVEKQRAQKSEYMMEEFVLYVFLGVFVICIVDGFSRSGRYVR